MRTALTKLALGHNRLCSGCCNLYHTQGRLLVKTGGVQLVPLLTSGASGRGTK